jgi:hypothetical protein
MLSSPKNFLMAMTIDVCILLGESLLITRVILMHSFKDTMFFFVSREAYVNLLMVVDHPFDLRWSYGLFNDQSKKCRVFENFELGRFMYSFCVLV